MKRTLLVGASLLALSGPAGAQGTPVYDNANIIQRGLQFTQTMLQWRDQLVGMEHQLQQLRATVNSVSGIRSVGEAGQLLMAEASRSPGAPSQRLAGALSGIDELPGMAGHLTGNSYAEPMGDDPEAMEMHRRRRALANIQANAMTGIVASEGRVRGLLELLNIVEAQRDVHGAQTLGNRIAAEQVYVQNEGDRLKRLEIMIATQRDVNQMRDQEAARQGAQQWHDATTGVWDMPWR